MNLILYNPSTKSIYTLESQKITVYDLQLNLLTEITLRAKEAPLGEIMWFEVSEDAEIITTIHTGLSGSNYVQYNRNGDVIYTRHLSDEKEDWIIGIDSERKIKVLSMYEHFSHEGNCIIIDGDNMRTINLHDETDDGTKDWGTYEYVEGITGTNKPNQFAFINVHANYGVNGVKIMRFTDFGKLEIIYDMDDFYDVNHNLTFHPDGDKFIVLLFKYDEYAKKDYFSICEYATDNNKPLRVFRTNFNHQGQGKIKTQYITDTLLCISRYSDLIIFDLNTGRPYEIITKDEHSPFYAGPGILIYFLKNNVTIARY